MAKDEGREGREQLRALGEFIRAQRRRAELSLRDLAARANVSNPYLSQLERGLHEPSVRVLKSIATALDVSAEALLAQAGILERTAGIAGPAPTSTEEAILADPRLSSAQKDGLLAVYRSYLAEQGERPGSDTDG